MRKVLSLSDLFKNINLFRKNPNIEMKNKLVKELCFNESPVLSCDLSNGIKLVCEERPSSITSIGCCIQAGSMYEEPCERGSSLFLEHLIFHRTKSRTRDKIAEDVAEIGGSLSATAHRDMFVLRGTGLTCGAEKIIELLADVIFNDNILIEDVKMKKSIIQQNLNNIGRYHEKIILDYLTNIAYQGTNLEKSVFPSSQCIRNLSVQEINSFKKRLFNTRSITLICSGGLCMTDFQKMVCTYFSNTENCNSESSNTKIHHSSLKCFRFTGSDMRLRHDDKELGYVAIGVEGPSYLECLDRCTMEVARTIVGSWNKSNSGSNHNAPYIAHCAFKTNLCDEYKSFTLDWYGTSLWGCYFVSDKLYLEDMTAILQKQWIKLCSSVSSKEVIRAVNQCKFEEMIKLSDPIDRFYDILYCIHYRGRYMTMRERLEIYDCVTDKLLREVTEDYIYNHCPVVVALGRIENLPDYNVIRSGMYSFFH